MRSLIVLLIACSAGWSQIQYAQNFVGADFGARVNACIAALPKAGGICDARQFAGTQTISTTIAVGSQTQPVTLLLPNGTLALTGGAQILVFNASQLVGSAKTTISGSGATAGFVAQGVADAQNVNGVFLANLSISGNSTTGSVGIRIPGMGGSILRNVAVSEVDYAVKIGGTGTCACYNSFYNLQAHGITAGVLLGKTANMNQFFGGTFGSPGSAVIGDQYAGTNQFYSPAVENSGSGFDLAGECWSVYSPYIEAVTKPIILRSGARANQFYGSGAIIDYNGIQDDSGNDLNFTFLTGGGGGSGGIPPHYLSVSKGITFGKSFGNPGSGVDNKYILSLLTAGLGVTDAKTGADAPFSASYVTSTALAGSGQSYACLDAAGKLVRSDTPCR